MAASVAPIAQDMQVESTTVRLPGLAMPALVLALSLNRICDGMGRPFFGWVSDRIGRELTMALAFIIGGGALLMLDSYGTDPLGFVLLTAAYFGVYGEVFSLFPATAADTFGARFATANVGMLYTAKGTGSLLVPVAVSIARSHGWGTVFTLAMSFNLLAALLAVFVLTPLRQQHFAKAARSSSAVFQTTTRRTRSRKRP
jgi:MFS transporter, OFA family, oxalate/formate antiporter